LTAPRRGRRLAWLVDIRAAWDKLLGRKTPPAAVEEFPFVPGPGDSPEAVDARREWLKEQEEKAENQEPPDPPLDPSQQP